MTAFTRRLSPGIMAATYTPIDRRGALGTVKSDPIPIMVIIDEGGKENWQSTEAQHASSVLIYAHPTAPIDRDCVGGHITIRGGRTFRIDGYDVGKNQRLGIVEHIELTCSEQI